MNRTLALLIAAGLVFGGCSGGDTTTADAEAAKPKVVNADNKEVKSAKKDKGKVTEPAIDTSGFVAAPAWSMPDLEGDILTNNDFLGKVVLLDFWATWCGPCKMSIPHLKDLYTQYEPAGVEVIGVSLDQKGPSVVIPFVNQAEINYPIVMGNGKVAMDFGNINSIPTAFIISQDGKIYKKYVGFQPKQVYERDIKALLGMQAG